MHSLEDLLPVSGDELAFAMKVGEAAALGRTPNSSIATDDATSGDPSLADTLTNRAALAIMREFGSEKGTAIILRVWALGALMEDQRLAPLFRELANGDVEIDGAVYEIAATMALNKDGNFDEDEFCCRALALAPDLREK